MDKKEDKNIPLFFLTIFDMRKLQIRRKRKKLYYCALHISLVYRNNSTKTIMKNT